MVDLLLIFLSSFISENSFLTPLLAFFAGMVTSLTPCSLSSVPIVIAYVSGTGEDNTRKSFFMSLVFVFGSAITFTSMGAIAAISGNLLGNSSSWWYIVLGIIMLLISMQMLGIFQIMPQTCSINRSKKKGVIGALFAGILAGIFSSPCCTPVLIALLALVAGNGNIVFGIVSLLMYSIGHGLLCIIAGTSIGFSKKISSDEKHKAISKYSNFILGVLILLISFYMFYLGF